MNGDLEMRKIRLLGKTRRGVDYTVEMKAENLEEATDFLLKPEVRKKFELNADYLNPKGQPLGENQSYI